MLNKEMRNDETVRSYRTLVIYIIVGAVVGAVLSYLYSSGMFNVFVVGTILGLISTNTIVSGIIWGCIIGAIIGGIVEYFRFQDYEVENSPCLKNNEASEVEKKIEDKVTIKLREEKLDISKEKIQTGEVKVHKEVTTEEKNIKVPVTHEELIIEKAILNSDDCNNEGKHTETIRIPLSEEQIDIEKRKVNLEDVSVYPHQFQEIKQVNENLKKEKAYIKAKGNAKIIEKKTRRE